MRYPLAKKTNAAPGGQFGATPYPLLAINPDGTEFGYKHHGYDDPCSVGTPVYATEDMTIEFGGWAGNAGNMIIGVVSNRQWRFLHLNQILVSAGSKVVEGQLIGYTGNTGYSSGAHLHFDLAVNGKYVDPLSLIDKEADMPATKAIINHVYLMATGAYPTEDKIKKWTGQETNSLVSQLYNSIAAKARRAKIKAQASELEATKKELTEWKAKYTKAKAGITWRDKAIAERNQEIEELKKLLSKK